MVPGCILGHGAEHTDGVPAKEYGSPDLSNLRYISIDEFATHKGQVYKTIVVDLETGRIVFVGDGNGKASLEEFGNKLGDRKNDIKAVCTDLSSAYTGAVTANLPNASLVVDHFHVVKLMNERIDQLRRQLWHAEKDVNKRKVIKGTRWILLRNGNDIFDAKYKTRLDNVLNLNEPLMIAYYLKEDLREIWNQTNKDDAELVLNEWVRQAMDSKYSHWSKWLLPCGPTSHIYLHGMTTRYQMALLKV